MAFEFIPDAVEPWLWITGIGGVIAWMSHMSFCLRKNRKRTWRLEKGFILSMRLTAKLTKRAHQNDPEIIRDVDDIERFVNVVLEPDSNADSDDFRLFK